LYVSNGDSTEWGEDILGGGVIMPDRYVNVELLSGWNGGLIDILIVDEDGDTYSIYDKRIRSGETIIVTLADLD